MRECSNYKSTRKEQRNKGQRKENIHITPVHTHKIYIPTKNIGKYSKHTHRQIHACPQNTSIYTAFIHIWRRRPWCNEYLRRKRTRRLEFKPWMRLFAFHMTLILLGKVWIQLSSHQLWVNSRTDRALKILYGNQSRRRNLWIQAY